MPSNAAGPSVFGSFAIRRKWRPERRARQSALSSESGRHTALSTNASTFDFDI